MEMIYNRLLKNYKKLKNWIRSDKIEAYRLYDRDIPEYPFIIDCYGGYLVLYDRRNQEIDYTFEKSANLDNMMNALSKLFLESPKQIILKERRKQKGISQYEKISRKQKYISITEGPCQFLVNIWDYLDTGLFLDHRPLRKIIYKQAKDKKILNLFSYTGSISVAGAIGGGLITSVDLSNTYLNWAHDNFKHNNIDVNQHEFIRDNVVEYLNLSQNSSRKFDLIILDPPTFSNSKRMEEIFDVQKDHFQLISNCLNLLKDEGLLYFSTNKKKFKYDPAINEIAKLRDISNKTIPQDFRDNNIHHCYLISRP